MLKGFHKVVRHKWYFIHSTSTLSDIIFPIHYYQIPIHTPTLNFFQILLYQCLLLVLYHSYHKSYVLPPHEVQFPTILVLKVGSYEAASYNVLCIMFLHNHQILSSIKSSIPLKPSGSMSYR